MLFKFFPLFNGYLIYPFSIVKLSPFKHLLLFDEVCRINFLEDRPGRIKITITGDLKVKNKFAILRD